MHLVIMRNDKAIMFDTVTTGPSLLRLPKGNCRLDLRSREPGTEDCAAHAVEFDFATGGVRALKVGYLAPVCRTKKKIFCFLLRRSGSKDNVIDDHWARACCCRS